MWKIALSTTLTLLLAVTVTVSAQQPIVSDSRLGVDRVRLASGETLFGFVLSIEPDQTLVLAVERAWLAKTYPGLSQRFTSAEGEMIDAARKQLLGRVQTWWDARGQEPGVLQGVLQSELDRLQKPAEPTVTLFLTIKLLPGQVRDKTLQPAERRQIAGLAWQHGLDAPTTTPASNLARQLVAQGVDVSQERVDLADQVAAIPLTEKQWAARRALVEYRFREAVEYQGSGSTFVRQGDAADVSALLTQMLGGAGGGAELWNRIGAELGLPEFRKPAESQDWYRKVTQAVEGDGFCGVRITRLHQSLTSSQVRVDTHFLAMEQPGEWFEVIKFTAVADSTATPADRIERIKSDPQVKLLLETLNGLGLPIDSARIDQALRHGAATQIAMEQANKQFQEFLAHTKAQLDAPLPSGL